MQDRVSKSHKALFARVSSVALLGGLVVSCSSGFQRFDTALYDNAIPLQTSQAQNPYPGGIDRQTTASIGSRLKPAVNIAPASVPQGVYHKPEPTYIAAQQPAVSSQAAYAPKPYQPYVAPQQQASSAYQSARKPLSRVSSVTQTSLPKPTYAAPAVAKPAVVQKVAAYVPPKPAASSNTVYIPKRNTDVITTSAIKPVAPAVTKVAAAAAPLKVAAAPTTTTNDGWNAAGGTTIAVRQGETLYNISKRYGVPVSAIRSANNMKPGANLQAGQNIIIPNYVFTNTSGVSAPDNDPKTRAARASTGYLGEANQDKVAYPTRRPYAQAAKDVETNVQLASTPQLVSVVQAKAPVIQSSDSYYTVQPGDTLSRIARVNGTSVASLQDANGLSGSNIRIGQKLNLPTGHTNVTTASVTKPVIVANKPLPANVDPITTSSLKPNTVTEEKPAPARTGISDFRWPVNGRVVSNFGESGTNGKNEGIDISVPEGTAVHAAENGVVIYAGDEISSYGKLILVRHTDGWVSAYAHNRDFEVKKGDQVRRGQIIARSGRTGDAGRPKVHFELRKDSSPVNPKKYLAG